MIAVGANINVTLSKKDKEKSITKVTFSGGKATIKRQTCSKSTQEIKGNNFLKE